MDETIQNDVKEVEETTVVPSTTEETSETPVVPAENESAVKTEESEPQTVPYDRFKEVNEESKQTKQTVEQLRAELEAIKANAAKPNIQQDPEIEKQKTQAKEQLKTLLSEMGYVNKDDIVRQEQDKKLEETLKKAETEFSGKDGRPKFNRREVIDYAINKGISDPVAAYTLMHMTELTNWQVQKAIKQSKGISTEGSNGSGSANAGVTNDDLMAAIKKGDQGAKHLYLKRLSSQLLNSNK